MQGTVQGRDRTWKRDDPGKQSCRAGARAQMMAHTASNTPCLFQSSLRSKMMVWRCSTVGITKYFPEMGLLLSVHLSSSHHLKDYGPREGTQTGNNTFSQFFCQLSLNQSLIFFHVVFQVTFDLGCSSSVLVFSDKFGSLYCLQKHL